MEIESIIKEMETECINKRLVLRALDWRDQSFLVAMLNELSHPPPHPNPDDHSRYELILDRLQQFFPNSFCRRLADVILWPKSNLGIGACEIADELFTSSLSAAFWHGFLKPALLVLRDEEQTATLHVANYLLPYFDPNLVRPNDWAELIDGLCRSLDSKSEQIQEFAVTVIDKLITNADEQRLEHRLEALCNTFKQKLGSDELPMKMKVVIVKASFSCILYYMSPENDDILQDLLRKVMNTVFVQEEIKFQKSEEEYARLIIEHLILLSRVQAVFLRNQIDKVLRFMFAIMEDHEYEENTRLLSMEFVLVLVEEGHRGYQVLVDTGGSHIRRMISHMLSMLGSVADYGGGNVDERDVDAQQLREFAQGLKSLARFAPALGGRFLLEGFPQPLESCFSSKIWKNHRAAISYLAVIAKHCSKAIKFKVSLVADPVMEMVEDIHPRVRWAAVNAIVEFSNNLSPEFQRQYYQKVLPALTKALKDFKNFDIQVQAAMAVAYFSEKCTSNMLAPYIDEIISQLLRCLQKGEQPVKQWALTALAFVARSLQDGFQRFYRTVIPYLKVMMMKATEESNNMLLAISVECITIIWMAVGKENFSNDILEVVQLLVSSAMSKLEIHDPMRKQVLQAWGRLCSSLGHDFQPYMSAAIPLLLQSAKLTLPDNAGNEESDERNGIEETTLEEKATACKVLCSCIAELKEDFDLWIDKAAETLVPLLKFHLDDDVRIAAVLAMKELLKSSKAAMEKRHLQMYDQKSSFEKLCSYVVQAQVEALEMEPLIEISGLILDSLKECIEMISGPFLDTDHIRFFLNATMEVLETTVSISYSKKAAEQGEEVSNKVCTCLKTFIRTHKASLSQFFDQLLSCMKYMWDNDKTIKERRIALRIFTVVVEQFGEEALKFCEDDLILLFKACNNDIPEVKQVNAQGIGVAAEFGGSIFKTVVDEALCALNAVIGNLMVLHLDYIPAHFAAVLALGKICLFHYDRINAAEVFSTWLSHLPIKYDLCEAKATHDLLCSIVDKLNEELLRQQDANLAKIISIFAEILWADDDSLATKETAHRVIDQLKYFKSRLPFSAWSSILSSLEPSRQNILQLSLSSQFIVSSKDGDPY